MTAALSAMMAGRHSKAARSAAVIRVGAATAIDQRCSPRPGTTTTGWLRPVPPRSRPHSINLHHSRRPLPNRFSCAALSGYVFIIFLILKLCEVGIVADWPWWIVASPLLLTPFPYTLLVAAAMLLAMGVAIVVLIIALLLVIIWWVCAWPFKAVRRAWRSGVRTAPA